MLERYVAQVRLLVDVLPDIAKESAFALKGGTAINLFYRDMPRLSVDVDLTWLPVGDPSRPRDSSRSAVRGFDRLSAVDAGRRPALRPLHPVRANSGTRFRPPPAGGADRRSALPAVPALFRGWRWEFRGPVGRDAGLKTGAPYPAALPS